MILQVGVGSIIAYLFFLFKYRNEKIKQQVFFLFVYLVGLTIIGELDVLLPIYFVFSFLPFISKMRKITVFTGFLIGYFGLYLVIGMLMQNTVGAIVTLVAKIWQLIVFFIVMDAGISIENSDYKTLIKYGVIAETMLGIYLLFSSTNIDTKSGLVRLVSNAQPITGNIATAMLPISVFYYMHNRENAKATYRLIWFNLIFLLWIVLSGTRGYTLEYAATMVLIYYDYFTNNRVGGRTRRNRVFVLGALGVLCVLLVVVVPGILERASSILRLNGSVGIRTFENAAALEFLKTSSPLTEIFGIGLGGTGGQYSSMQLALYRQFSLGMWDRQHYLYDSGALFHNLYANVIVNLGLVGVIVFIAMNIEMWRRITLACGTKILSRRIMHLFQLSFMIMNYYRWSAVCGIAEMIIFALVLKRIKQEENYAINFECRTEIGEK